MGFEEFFENNRRDYKNYRGNNYPEVDESSYTSRYPFDGHRHDVKWQNFLEKIRSNNRLKLFVLLAGFIILTIVVILIIALFPLIVKLINYISQNGLQSIVESITGFLDKIWKGSAN
jgi:hypothetical protein